MLNLVKVSICRGKGDKGIEFFWDVTLYQCFSTEPQTQPYTWIYFHHPTKFDPKLLMQGF